MSIDERSILAILDSCLETFDFPMLDDGISYVAATRLSLHRSSEDWALVLEVFEDDSRGWPCIVIRTFASTVCNRDIAEHHTPEWISQYVAGHPNDVFRPIYPMECDDLLDENEFVAEGIGEVLFRGSPFPIPSFEQYSQHGITLEQPPRAHRYELCRYLAEAARDMVLATPAERRMSVLPSMSQILQLEEWCHPSHLKDERPSKAETFQQLARVLATGNIDLYRPSQEPNTHWRNWTGEQL